MMKIFKLPTPAQAAAAELAQAELSLLHAHTAAEQAAAHLQFQQARVERLRALVGESAQPLQVVDLTNWFSDLARDAA